MERDVQEQLASEGNGRGERNGGPGAPTGNHRESKESNNVGRVSGPTLI